jgi:3-oxoacyl-[acyl-carrier protein] reductase
VKNAILITGTSRGLGFETTKCLLKKGINVIGVSRTPFNLELSHYMESGAYAHIQLDLENPDSCLILKEFLMTSQIALTGFVNNAAIAYDDLVSNASYEKLERMYKVNTLIPIMITREVIRNFLYHEQAGSIIHISSISAHTGYKGLSMYASTKGALEAFSKGISREWGEKGIRSNSLVCGFMETEMSETLSTQQKNRIYQRTSLKKATEINSVTEMIAYLLSEKASSVTGQKLFVDSGTI